MNDLVNIVIAAADLAEAEGRALRHAVVRTTLSLVLALGACLVALAGGAALAWAGFLALAAVLPTSAAAAVLGLVLACLAGVILWTARRLLH